MRASGSKVRFLKGKFFAGKFFAGKFFAGKFFAVVLVPLSWVYMLLVWCRNQMFDRGYLTAHKLPGFVISIGNIAVGGTGKSPLVIDYCQRIVSMGGTPAVLTRGYRSGLESSEWQVLQNGNVVAGTSRSTIMADEARMQSLAVKDLLVVVGARRRAAVLKFLSEYKGKKISHWVLDDGFQHRSLFRDLDVVVVDARTPTGRLLPAGLYRELGSSFSRADVAILTKAENQIQVESAKEIVRRMAPSCEVIVAEFSPEAPACRVEGRNQSIASAGARWAMISSIARPEDFAKSLLVRGIIPVARFIFPDHRAIELSEIELAKGSFDQLITTEKDWARDESKFRSLGIPVYVLPQKVSWSNGKMPDLIGVV
jgi:tetraacyldisaccharide 4'-kinase